MRTEEHREAALAVQPLDECAHLRDALGIEAVRRLIKQHDLRLRQQRLREPKPLAHALAVGADLVVDARGEADKFHCVPHFLAWHERTVAREDFQIPPSAQVLIKARRLKNRADLRKRTRTLALHADAADERLALIGKNHAEQDAERRAFPRAVMPEQAEDFSALHGKRKPVQRGLPRETLFQIREPDRFHQFFWGVSLRNVSSCDTWPSA